MKDETHEPTPDFKVEYNNTRLLLMYKPSSEPPYFVYVFGEACEKLPNSFSNSADVIRIPRGTS